MERFLKAKHWQLFLIMFIVPFGTQFMAMRIMMANGFHAMPPIWLFPIVMIINMGTLFGWMYSISTLLQSQLPEGMTMKLNRFKIFITIPVIYILTFVLIISGVLSGMFDGIVKPSPSESLLFGMMGLIIPLHLFSMFCIVHTMYFCAKTIKSVELQRRAKVSDYLGDLMLLWFYPIGIWVIQPKLNEYAQKIPTT